MPGRPKKHKVSVPASQQVVRNFIDQNRKRYEQDLDRLLQHLENLKKTEPSLRNVYKIYSRKDSPEKDALKSTKKIRMKFNNFNLEHGNTEASLFDVPDIVGVTIVVTYPSDIALVAEALDAAVDREELDACHMGDSDSEAPFRPRHGRALASKGYLACHYNLRMPGAVEACPIVEVQIKTVLHDAWGVKTHDLTYKPVGRIGDELITNFELLGANLANLDRQSDAMRQSIFQTFAVRDRKRRLIQNWVLLENCNTNIEQVADSTKKSKLTAYRDTISGMSSETLDEEAQPILLGLLKTFKDADLRVASSILLCYLAVKVHRASYFDHAQEAIEARQDDAEGIDRLGIHLEGALAMFAGGDVGEAIDIAEEGLQIAAELDKSGEVSDRPRYERILLGLNSNLAYYYADIIGSHDGDGRDAIKRALEYKDKAIAYYYSVGLPKDGLEGEDNAIRKAFSESFCVHAFGSLDNEAYVRIQTAVTVDEVRSTEKRLEFIYALAPNGLEESIQLASDYHDYCARTRLSELERGRVP